LIKIDCYISEGCASEDGLRKNIADALEQKSLEAEVAFHRINEMEANELGLRGSPTVLINGVDILPGETPGIA
jgi:hypothetical protein